MKVRELKAIINERISLIKQSNRSFKDIFNCVHYQENNTFSEELDGFKIVKTTYKEAKMSSILMGHYFDTNISLPKGSYVGLMMENKKKWIFSFWGLLMAGFKPVLLNTRLGLTLNKDVVKLLDLKMIVSDQEIGLTKDEININKIKLEETDRTIDDFVWENEIALTTSATTLNIKICVYKGENITAQILNTDRIISENTLIMKHYNKELKQLAFLPFYHVFGLIATYFWFAFFSRTFVFLKDYSIDTILNTIKRHKVTHVFAVPLLWHGIHKEIIKQVNQKGKKTKKKFDRAIKFSIFIQRIFPRWGLKLVRKMFKEVNNNYLVIVFISQLLVEVILVLKH
jgi:long-subunit acyl-CoA synthetase (AMP-forming)